MKKSRKTERVVVLLQRCLEDKRVVIMIITIMIMSMYIITIIKNMERLRVKKKSKLATNQFLMMEKDALSLRCLVELEMPRKDTTTIMVTITTITNTLTELKKTSMFKWFKRSCG